MIITPFAPLPRTILHDASLPPGAKTLYAALQDHARQRGLCFPGYRRLCALMGRCENTVRRWMRALIEAGYVMQTRRGHRRSNVYTLTPFVPATTAETGVLEPQKVMPIKIAFEASNERDSSAPTPTLSLSPEPEAEAALPPELLALVTDISRELRDAAPRSTATRVGRMITKAAPTTDMYTCLHTARTITRRKLGRIRRRNTGGQAMPMPYFLACLARVVGVVPAPVRESTPVAVPTPPAEPVEGPERPALPRDEGRAIFWQEVEAACGVGGPRAFVAECRRTAPYPDVQWAVRLVRDARK